MFYMIFCAVKESDKYTTKQRNAPKKCNPEIRAIQIAMSTIRRMLSFLFLEPIFREKSLMLLTNKTPPNIEKRIIKTG